MNTVFSALAVLVLVAGIPVFILYFSVKLTQRDERMALIHPKLQQYSFGRRTIAAVCTIVACVYGFAIYQAMVGDHSVFHVPNRFGHAVITLTRLFAFEMCLFFAAFATGIFAGCAVLIRWAAAYYPLVCMAAHSLYRSSSLVSLWCFVGAIWGEVISRAYVASL